MTPTTRRKLSIGLALGVVALTGFGGWLLGKQVRSPAEAAARTAPPVASPILATVESRSLSTDLVTRGTGRFGSARSVLLARSALRSGTAVLTRAAEAGTDVKAGDVLAEVSGRPVFAFVGAQPMYRDMGPGIRGADVLQLENALRSLGYATGAVDGLYDAATGSAVSALYARNGSTAMAASDAAMARLAPVVPIDGSVAVGGVQLPANEVVFFDALPVRAGDTNVEPGAPISGALMTATDSSVAIDTSVPVEEGNLLKRGMTVLIDEPSLSIHTTGTVRRVSDTPGTDGVDGFHIYVEVAVPNAPRTLIQASVRLTIPIKSTNAKVLVVPVTALSIGPDGGSRVRLARNGQMGWVTVVPGLAANGLTEIRVTKNAVVAGDTVVVGAGVGATP